MSTETTTPKTRTITLTNRRPVKIREDAWPEIAKGGEVWSYSDRRTKAFIRVRQHADGRAIVYGHYKYDSPMRYERPLDERAGELLASGDDVAAAIHRVAASLVAQGGDKDMMDRIACECIAALPAETI